MNTSRILRDLWVSHTISRVELARDLDLNKSTISQIIGELLERGVVLEVSEGTSGPQGGRRPVHLELNRRYGYVLGFELRPESYTVVAVDLTGDILFSRTEAAVLNADNLIEATRGLLDDIPQELSWIGIPLLGVGFGISGIVNSTAGSIRQSIPLGIEEPMDFISQIEERFPYPVFHDNDANCCAWGELAFHRSKQLRNFMFTLVEFHQNTRKQFYENTSVGLGIVIDGRVYTGMQHSAGEFRSVFCADGDRGQFKASSEEENQYRRIEENPARFKDFVVELSKHIALFVNTFNLNQIFLGGDIERYQDLVMPILLKEINSNWSYDGSVDCQIRFSSLGDKSVAYGAAGLVLERLFVDPEVMDAYGDSDWYESDALDNLLQRSEKVT
jgi:predicted NBD/HSP70 family sugar kinase